VFTEGGVWGGKEKELAWSGQLLLKKGPSKQSIQGNLGVAAERVGDNEARKV